MSGGREQTAAVTVAQACGRHTIAIYRGPTLEGAIRRCLWCRREWRWRKGAWENGEEACAPLKEFPSAERAAGQSRRGRKVSELGGVSYGAKSHGARVFARLLQAR